MVGARHFPSSAVGSGTSGTEAERAEGAKEERQNHRRVHWPGSLGSTRKSSLHRLHDGDAQCMPLLVSAYREAKTPVRGRFENLVILAVHIAPV